MPSSDSTYFSTLWNSPSGASGVTSVFGRTGVVVSAVNDYNFNQLAGAISLAQLIAHASTHAEGGSDMLLYETQSNIIANSVFGA